MSIEYILQVKEDDAWKNIALVSEMNFDESDYSFYPGKNKDFFYDYEGKVLRLYRLIYTPEEEILGHEVCEFKHWRYYQNRIIALNPSKNFKRILYRPQEWKNEQ